MKTNVHPDPTQNRPPQLTYSAFCLAPGDPRTRFWPLRAPVESTHCFCPGKQRRALLESNPPRDNWIERRRNKIVSTFGEATPSPKANWQTFISEPEHAFPKLIQTLLEELESLLRDGRHQQTDVKTSLNKSPFFRSKRINRLLCWFG